MTGLVISWTCLECKQRNCDMPDETAAPICSACERVYHWEELVPLDWLQPEMEDGPDANN